MPAAWYVARTNPRAEYPARNQLEINGFEYYLPVTSTESPRPGREDAPLFPSYMFLRYDAGSPESSSLRSIPGLAGLVNFDGVAPPVPDEVIDSLRQAVAEMNESRGISTTFQPGDRVWVRWGASETEDLAKVISDTKSPQGRIRILIEFLGRSVHGEVSRSKIRSVHPGEALNDHGQGPARRRTRGKGRYVQGAAHRLSHNALSSS